MFSKCMVATLLLMVTRTEAAACNPSNTAVTGAACDCATSATDDAAIGAFCITKGSTDTVFAACTAGVVTAECACGSLDNSVGTITGYVSGKTCTKGAGNSDVGAFAYPACTPSNTAALAQCTCVSSGDTAVGGFCITKGSTDTVFAACTAGVVTAECACGSLDNSVGTITGYVSGKTCTKGAGNSDVGAFSTTIGACTASNTAALAQCTCVSSGDTAIGAFCIDKAGTDTVFAACAAGVVTAECACGSADNSVGTIAGYVSGKTCTKGAGNGDVGAFSDAATPSPATTTTTTTVAPSTPAPAPATTTTAEPKAPAPEKDVDASSTLSTCALTLVASLFAMAVLC